MALNPFLVLVAPLGYMLVAQLSLLQFTVLLNLFAKAMAFVKSTPALKVVEPAVKAFVQFSDRVHGTAAKFQPNTTHVILVAILLAVVVHLERVRGAVKAR